MKIIIKERGKGKTTALIYTSAITGYRIVTHSELGAQMVAQMAEDLKIKIPEPMGMVSYIEKRHGLRDEGIFIDNLDLALESILHAFFETPVKAVTMTINE